MDTQGSTSEPCRLCDEPAESFPARPYLVDKKSRVYLQCPRCGLIQLSSHMLPDAITEQRRYLQHRNSAEDPRYVEYQRKFASRTVFRVLEPPAKILEIGSGPTPVLAELLRDAGYSVEIHDPYFFSHPRVFDDTFDGVVAVEVLEHVHYPGQFFDRLARMVIPGGYCCFQTGIQRGTVEEFSGWWYRQDVTHVCFFSERTITYIANQWFLDRNPTVEGNTVIFRSRPVRS